MKKGLGTIGIILIVLAVILVVGVGGYYGYKAIFSQGKKYCCLPECKELTKNECTEIEGKSSDKEKCSEAPECLLMGGGQEVSSAGYTALANAEATTEAAVGTGHYTFSLDVYTCESKIADAQWTGKWDWLWTYTNEAGSHNDPASAEVTFKTDDDGNFSVNIGNSPAKGQITKDSIKLEFEMPGVVGKVTAVGSVNLGGKTPCPEKTK